MAQPMLAKPATSPVSLTDPLYAYEPKYDGMRANITSDAGKVRITSRDGNDKTVQFPEIVAAFKGMGDEEFDGEIVAVDKDGEIAPFQELQGRMHLLTPSRSSVRTAFVAFDLIKNAGGLYVGWAPLIGRDGLETGGEGVMAKRLTSRYAAGKRSDDWLKLKFNFRQEFVVGGFTEPKGSRTGFGSMILGVYNDAGELRNVGSVGTGFTQEILEELTQGLKALESKACPFTGPVDAEKPHWIAPVLVAEVKFYSWTRDGRLRHPVYIGLRNDKPATEVRREANLTTKAIVQE